MQFMGRNILWYSTGVYSWSAYFQYLFNFNFLKGVAVASYYGDTTSRSTIKTNDLVMKEMEHFLQVLFQWFHFNCTKKIEEKVIYYSQETTT